MGTFSVGCLIKNSVNRKQDKPAPLTGAVIQGEGGPGPRVTRPEKRRKRGET